MCMLTKRTNILFDENLWKALTQEARKRKVSVSKLVREAAEQMYLREKELEQRREALSQIKKIRKISKGKIDYKELINYGRRY